MKNKVRPNQSAYMDRCINRTKNCSKTKEEKGITLIVLIVTVTILVILTSVAVAQITGDEGIIQSAETAVDEYDYQQYKEQLQQLAHSIILADSLLGRTTTVTSMAEDMLNETWIKEAVPNEESKDIIVTVDKEYMYQVYYDELTGILEIEGIGKDDGSAYPTITAYYDETKGRVEAIANCEGGIARIELIYKGEVVQVSNSDTASFEVIETGWYQVKAIANNGNERYANVRVTGKIKAPIIAVTSSGEEENGWYGKDNVAVEVTISVEDEKITGISYKKNIDEEYTYIEGKNVKLTINTSGRTMIYAYGVTTDGEETSISSFEIKYDNEKPNIGGIAVNPEVPASGWYITDVDITLLNMNDITSGIAGYYYWEVTGDTADIPKEEKIYVSGEEGKVTMQSEGEKTIAFQAKDNAGNISGISSITIRKDSIAPDDFMPSITNETATGFTINGTSSDSTSGRAGYYFYVDGILQNSEISTSGTYNVTGLNANKTYSVYMEAIDNAGNRKKSTSIVAKTKGELLAPKISLTGANQTNGYYTGNVTVTIEDSAGENMTDVTQIRYQVTGANQIAETTISGRTATFEITVDGTSTITAQAVNSNGNLSETATQIVNKDSTPPTASLTAGTVGETTIEVTANGNDNVSGIASYEFQYSTTNSEEGFVSVSIQTGTVTSCSYTYSGLISGATYYLRVIVKDKAGNSYISAVIDKKTEEKEMTEDELDTNIGKYVDYTPVSGSFGDHVGTAYNSYDYTVDEGQYGEIIEGHAKPNETLTTIEGLKWRILSASEDNLTLICDTVANEQFGFGGTESYNNCVLLLNNACKAMYSNNELWAVGRSLNLDDIEKHSKFDKTTFVWDINGNSYGTEYSLDSSGAFPWLGTTYPTIFSQEETLTINGAKGPLGQSEQDAYVQGDTSLRGDLKAKMTYYRYTMTEEYMEPEYIELFSYKGDITNDIYNTYWLATRCFSMLSGQENFRTYFVCGADVDAYAMGNYSFAIRPVVDIDLTKVNVGGTGTGTAENPYSITAK